MEGHYIFTKDVIAMSHLPTALLVVGYAIFWLEMYVFQVPGGITTPLAWSLWLILCFYVFVKRREALNGHVKELTVYWWQQPIGTKAYLAVGTTISVFILLCALYAALLPPHLMQESDVLNYHLTLPRQHLILHSFRHIPWSSADLFPLPIQFALAPYWLATNLPNKLPQVFFVLGLIAVTCRLAKYLGARKPAGVVLIAFAVMGSHNVGIQMGTAMLDLVICYLFLAFMDSFLNGNHVLAAVEFSFFLWSKSFIPFQMVLISVMMFVLFLILKRINYTTVHWGFSQEMKCTDERGYVFRFKNVLRVVVILSICIGGPFLSKSTYCSGTPLYPFGAGMVKLRTDMDATTSWQSLLKAAKAHISYKDSYGYGRSLKDFLQHFWLIAVPDKGVNNKFDYPVGLPYLLFAGPFVYFLYQSIRRRTFPIIPFFVVVYWLLWWAGAQQTRFLYIPIILMYIAVVAEIKNPSFFLKGAVLLALLLNALSVLRAHQGDFGAKPSNVLREKDLSLVVQSERYMSENRKGHIQLPFGDVAFAQFPVDVTREQLPFIISY